MLPAPVKVTCARTSSNRAAVCACMRRIIGVAPWGARSSSLPGYLLLSASSRLLFLMFSSVWLGPVRRVVGHQSSGIRIGHQDRASDQDRASGIEHRGGSEFIRIEHRSSGIGHRASVIGHRSSGISRRRSTVVGDQLSGISRRAPPVRAGSLRRAASRRGSSDCVGRLRRAAARRAQQTACLGD